MTVKKSLQPFLEGDNFIIIIGDDWFCGGYQDEHEHSEQLAYLTEDKNGKFFLLLNEKKFRNRNIRLMHDKCTGSCSKSEWYKL